MMETINNTESETNMILSSKLLQEMIGQVKEGLNRTEGLLQNVSELTMVISDQQKQSLFAINELKFNLNEVENRLNILIKEQSTIINGNIQLNSDQHQYITKVIEDIDKRSNEIFRDKIQLIIEEFGGTQKDHKEITAIIDNNDKRLIKFIEDKNKEILKEIDNYSNKVDSVIKKVDSLSALLNKIIIGFSAFVILVGFASAIKSFFP